MVDSADLRPSTHRTVNGRDSLELSPAALIVLLCQGPDSDLPDEP